MQVAEVRVVTAPGAIEVIAREKVAVTALHLEVLVNAPRDEDVGFGARIVIRRARRRRERTHRRDAIRAIPNVVRAREPEGVVIELRGDRL